MSRHQSDAPDRHSPSAPPASPHVEAHRSVHDDPSLVVQFGVAAGVVAAVGVLSYPAAAVAVVALAAAVGVVTTAVGRAVDRAAAREASVRVPGADVEVTVARSSGE